MKNDDKKDTLKDGKYLETINLKPLNFFLSCYLFSYLLILS